MVLYIIGVTTLDPMKHNLLFERFVSAARTEIKEMDGDIYISSTMLPDVDIDSDTMFKPLINKFLAESFPNKTCKIINLLTLSSKILIKECGKIVGAKEESEMNEVSALIPSVFGKPKPLKEAYDMVKEFKEWCDDNSESYETALMLQDLIKNKSVHASGIFISENDLDETLPVELTSKDKELVASFDMEYCGLLGIKMDQCS